MSRRSIALIAASALFLIVAALPSTAFAADPDVSGTVVKDGAPVEGARVSVWIRSTDMAFAATTDASGAWSVTTGVAVGQSLSISAQGAEVQSSPDADGCVAYTTDVGATDIDVTELPLAPVEVVLDEVIKAEVCSTTASPDPTSTAQPVRTHRPTAGPTPPATDTTGDGPGASRGTALIVAALASLVCLAVGAAARPAQRRRARGGGARS